MPHSNHTPEPTTDACTRPSTPRAAAMTRSRFLQAAGAGAALAAFSMTIPGLGFAWGQGDAGAAGASPTAQTPTSPVAGAIGTAAFAASRPERSVYIMVAADMHFISSRLTDHGPFFEQLIRGSDAKLMDYSEQIMDTLVEAAVAEKPDVLVIPGDLTYNGARESHEDVIPKLRRIRAAGIPVVVIPGNHDIECPQAARFEGDGYELVESVTAEEFASMYADFGYGDGGDGPGGKTIARDEASLSYVWELPGGLRLLMLDVNGTPSLGTALQGAAAPDTIAWIDEQLQDAAEHGARVISVSHQSLLQQTFIDYGYVVSNAADILPLYKQAGVLANLCGHLHLQHYELDGDGFADIATSALCVSPCQFARVVLSPGEGAPGAEKKTDDPLGWLSGPLRLAYATAPMDAGVAAWARECDLDDPDLLGFPDYARAFFIGDEADHEAAAALLGQTGFDNALELVDFSSDVNYHYFTGRLDLMEYRPDLIEQWDRVNALTGYYMRYIFEMQPVRDQNRVSVEAGAL